MLTLQTSCALCFSSGYEETARFIKTTRYVPRPKYEQRFGSVKEGDRQSGCKEDADDDSGGRGDRTSDYR